LRCAAGRHSRSEEGEGEEEAMAGLG
jgi:hypothetical protein